MNLEVMLLIIEISLTLVLTLFVLVIMLQQPLTPNLRVRFKNGKKLIKCRRGEDTTLSFYIENVGTLFAKPAALDVRGWPNFPSSFKLKQAKSITGISQKITPSVGGIVGGMNAITLPGRHSVFYKERWNFDIDVKIPEEGGKVYSIFIPLHHESGNCGTKVLKVKVV